MAAIRDTVGVIRLSSRDAESSRQQALHVQGLLWVVEPEKGRLAKAQHASLSQSMWFSDGKAIDSALVSTRVQGNAACVVLNVAVLCCDAGAQQRDVCPFAAQRCPPFQQRQQSDGCAQPSTSQTDQVRALCLDF